MGQRAKIIVSTGLAIFSMLFGAGNVVFPLDLGRVAGNMNFYAILGFLVIAVVVPFIGLIAMFLFDGDYKLFFDRMGHVAGFSTIAFFMALIGPFYAIPRTITLPYSTLKLYFPGLSLFLFSVVACLLIFLMSVRRRKILDILGNILSPLLVISLVILIVKGLISHPGAIATDFTRTNVFLYGLKEAYNTMDLLGAIFFAVVVLIGLKRSLGIDFKLDSFRENMDVFNITLVASVLGTFLLACIYVGFSYVASFYSSVLNGVERDTVLSVLSNKVLGGSGGLVASIVVSLACLTTAITLAAVVSEYVQTEIFRRKLSYRTCLLFTLGLTWVMSNLGFIKLVNLWMPVLAVIYPVLIVLTFVNLANKLWGFKPVKVPVLITFVISLIYYFV